MKLKEVEEVIACLGNERRVAYYFKDRYCLELIEYEIKRRGTDSLRVSELNKGNLAALRQKPVIAEVIKNCRGNHVGLYDLQKAWPKQLLCYVVTLATWGDGDRYCDQTSRKQRNLVLRINFDGAHIAAYEKLIKPESEKGPFEYWGHPVSRGRQKTIGWIRMDISFDTNEVLIEEIQTDWLRRSERASQNAKSVLSGRSSDFTGKLIHNSLANFDDLKYYVNTLLKPYRELWPELAMDCAIRFIRDELGITNIFYHTFETGIKIKGIWGKPPRSLYTKLPKKFGFELTDHAPEMLVQHTFARRCIKAINEPRWYKKCF